MGVTRGRGWAASNYSRAGWLGFAAIFLVFLVLGVVATALGHAGSGVVAIIVFAIFTGVCLVQATRAGARPAA